MEKEFVPYELAVKLKELGFNEPCFGSWETEYAKVPTYTHSCSQFYKNSNHPKGKVTAPTFSQAFRFFRENYMVHSSPRKYDETKWWVEWGTWTSPVFETFEEAELAWLTKLLEIVESKSE